MNNNCLIYQKRFCVRIYVYIQYAYMYKSVFIKEVSEPDDIYLVGVC